MIGVTVIIPFVKVNVVVPLDNVNVVLINEFPPVILIIVPFDVNVPISIDPELVNETEVELSNVMVDPIIFPLSTMIVLLSNVTEGVIVNVSLNENVVVVCDNINDVLIVDEPPVIVNLSPFVFNVPISNVGEFFNVITDFESIFNDVNVNLPPSILMG